MKRTTKKGFTLIELLAVIVILAIIALIAVPVIMNIINKTNKSAFKDTAYGIVSAGELYFAERQLDPNGMSDDVIIDLSDEKNTLGLKGDVPEGKIAISKEGKTALAIQNGRYCITKGFDDKDVTVTENYETCDLAVSGDDTKYTLSALAKEATFTKVDGSAYATPTVTVPECITNKTKCDAGTPVAVEVAPDVIYKFYVLNDDTTKNEVTLIMNRNLYSAEDLVNNTHVVVWINRDDYEDTDSCVLKEEFGFCNDQGPLTALAVLQKRTSGWTNIPAYTYTLENDADGYGGGFTYPNITGELVTDVRARLPKYSEIYAINNSGSLTNSSWLYDNLTGTGDNNTYGYWTSTAYSEFVSAWAVTYYGDIYNNSNTPGSESGLRPVIILSK